MAKVLQTNLQRAKEQQRDEFYTQLTDIEKQLRHYRDQLRGKVVFCNCDDPFESNSRLLVWHKLSRLVFHTSKREGRRTIPPSQKKRFR